VNELAQQWCSSHGLRSPVTTMDEMMTMLPLPPTSVSSLLINAGRSQRGWSRIGNFMQCPQKFAYDQRLNLDLIPASALTRGSMGHIIQAHQHAIWGCQQGGVWVDDQYHEDGSVFLAPEDALAAWCDHNRAGHEYAARMLETYRRYMARHPEPPGRVVAVEYPITAALGFKGENWGLWVLALEEAQRGFDEPRTSLTAFDGSTIIPTHLDSPGHRDHGKVITMTRRLDMAIKDRVGQTWIWDHKHQANVSPGRSVDAYAIDGGFAAFRIMGDQLYGNFGGLMLNLIQTQEPWRVARPCVPRTPHRDGHFAELLWRAEHQIARLDLEQPDLWRWPKAMHEVACYGRYGPCSGLKLCQYGPAAVDCV